MSADDIKPLLTDQHIDGIILTGGHRNATGGIYATSVYAFAREVAVAAIQAARASREDRALEILRRVWQPHTQSNVDRMSEADIAAEITEVVAAHPQGDDDARFFDRHRHPMGAERRGDWIVVAVSLDTLKHATESCPHLEYYPEDGSNYVMPVITDMDAFAGEFLGSLNTEAEDGSTLITRAFDKAIEQAVENGAEGVAVDDEAVKLRAAGGNK